MNRQEVGVGIGEMVGSTEKQTGAVGAQETLSGVEARVKPAKVTNHGSTLRTMDGEPNNTRDGATTITPNIFQTLQKY